MMEPNTATEEPVRSSEVDLLKRMLSIMKEIRDELKSSNANKERGGGRSEGTLTGNISNTLEQAPDIGIEPNNANENPAVSIKEGLDKNMSNTSEQIPHGSTTIAEERVEDINAKFWAAHQKSSTEHHIDLVKKMNSDINIILTFAGLLSAVLATFIIGMEPNPVDDTNTLLLYLLQATVNPDSVPDPSNILITTEAVGLGVFAQSYAYASFLASLLAGFVAATNKQRLSSYDTGGQGTLEARGKQRQMKLDGLESLRTGTIALLCPMLLQFSFVFLCVSLIINMWTRQPEISVIIIVVMCMDMVLYIGAIIASAVHPASPAQTPTSKLLAAIRNKMFPNTSPFICSMFVKSSAVRSILETSTNLEFVDAAAAIVPLVQWPPKLDASTSYAHLLENFSLRGHRPELCVKYGKAMARLCMQPVKIDSELLEKKFRNDEFRQTRICLIRDAFMDGRAAYDQLKNAQENDARLRHQASAHSALRTLVVHGQYDRLSRPDDEDLIWDGDLRWHHSCDGRKPSCEEFDWLIDYLAGDAEHCTDDETEGDALLALSAMQGLGSSTKQQSYISSLIRCMDSTRPPRVRHTALRAVFEAREELASITSVLMPPSVDTQLLDNLSRGLLTAVRPIDGQTTHDTEPDASFLGNHCYIRIIYALTKNDEWFQRLTRDGHDERCFSLVDGLGQNRHFLIGSYLLAIFSRISSSGRELPFGPSEEKWRSVVKISWETLQHATEFHNYVAGIPPLVTATSLNLTASDGVPGEWHTVLTAMVQEALVNLKGRQAILVKDGIAQAVIDAALSSTQGLHDELGSMVEPQNTSQRGNGASGL